jgi:hypothetical protein
MFLFKAEKGEFMQLAFLQKNLPLSEKIIYIIRRGCYAISCSCPMDLCTCSICDYNGNKRPFGNFALGTQVKKAGLLVGRRYRVHKQSRQFKEFLREAYYVSDKRRGLSCNTAVYCGYIPSLYEDGKEKKGVRIESTGKRRIYKRRNRGSVHAVNGLKNKTFCARGGYGR